MNFSYAYSTLNPGPVLQDSLIYRMLFAYGHGFVRFSSAPE